MFVVKSADAFEIATIVPEEATEWLRRVKSLLLTFAILVAEAEPLG